ncbi:hypothetical protein DPEC_G00080400 [Dallia pectoralis]|uniref:Uncharacterized protein n=1 Tax=Dallia pectoralis TaxID=75939 RepID=A0ACC2H5X5_DALPE|nr:hypothetical protein DPEC_G00080400 [Dallia pectoralis]
MLTDPELIAAAILIPKFKTCWTSDECVLKLGLDYIKSHLKEQVVVMTEGGDTYHSSEEEDFFSAIKQSRSQENTKQLETYLGCPGDITDVLKSFPAVFHFMELLGQMKVLTNCDTVDIIDSAMPFTICIAFLNSCVNPILYSFVGENFRKNLFRLLRCAPGGPARTHPPISSKMSTLSYRGSEVLRLSGSNKAVMNNSC